MITHCLPALKDNYFFILETQGKAVVIDPGEHSCIFSFLEKHSLSLTSIWLTHHHMDHIGGVSELLKRFPVPVYASEFDLPRLPFSAIGLKEGDFVSFEGHVFHVIEVPGHTLGHIAYHGEKESALFCGDTVFSLGCGRLFEGTPQMMLQSLNKIKKLSQDTQMYCSHEYTEANFNFLKKVAFKICPSEDSLEEIEAYIARRLTQEQRTVPTSIQFEKANNPFLRSDLKTFTQLRELRNNF